MIKLLLYVSAGNMHCVRTGGYFCCASFDDCKAAEFEYDYNSGLIRNTSTQKTANIGPNIPIPPTAIVLNDSDKIKPKKESNKIDEIIKLKNAGFTTEEIVMLRSSDE